MSITIERIRQVDWRDALLHVLGGAVVHLLLTLLFGVGALHSIGIITVGGFVREWVQAFRLGRELDPRKWSIDKWVESLAWPVGALALAAIMWLL